MGERGAGCLALMSRRGRAGVPRELLAELEATGARVVVCEGDVGREADVLRVLAEIAAECPPLRGIVHSAGSLDDGVVLQQTRERFKRVFASKVDGAMHLHNHTKDLALDHFILYSSAASVMGRPGQANYVAANAFLDELAHHRKSLGLAALSINWGGWRWVGLAAERAAGDQTSGHGMSEIEPEQGLMVLEMLMRGRAGQAAVMPIDFRDLGSQLAGIPMFSQLLSAAPDDAAVGPSFLPELLEAPLRERAMLVRRHIETIVMKILGIKGEHLPSDTQKFSDLGMDSLMSVELRNRLQHSFERVFPGTMAFDYPSLSALSTFVSDEVLGEEKTPAVAGDAPTISSDVAKLLDDVLVMDDAEISFDIAF
jgi:NAD(P)-dependent dehydrogenase (short-subunit alcohol dehydrogenase family)/acyl carrier protein